MPALSTYAVGSPTSKQISRLAASGARVIQPGMDGVVADGVTDDTAAFQAVFTAAAGGTIVIAEGNYLWRADGPRPLSGTDLYFARGAKIIAAVMDWASEGILSIYDKSNIKVFGGEIDGQRTLQSVGHGQHGVNIRDSHNIHIEGMYIHAINGLTAAGGAGGDGIQARGATNPGSTYVTVTKNKIDDVTRQGFTCTRGRYITVTENQFTGIVGTDPGGICDFEPDTATAVVEYCNFSGNYGANANYGIIFDGAASSVYPRYVTCRDNFIVGGIRKAHMRILSTYFGLFSGNFLLNPDDVPDGIVPYRCIVNFTNDLEFCNNQHRGMLGVSANEGHWYYLSGVNNRLKIHDENFFGCAGGSTIFYTSAEFPSTNVVIKNNNFVACGPASSGSVIQIRPTATASVSNLICEGNNFWETRSPAPVSAVDFTGVTAAMLADGGRIERNVVHGGSAMPAYSNFPAGARTNGNATLVAGAVTVTNARALTGSTILLSRKTAGGTLGNLTYTITDGTSFTITSSDAADTSAVSWRIVNEQ